MGWWGLVDANTGELLSVGSEAMFPDKDIHAFDKVDGIIVVDFVDKFDFSDKSWDNDSRTLIDRPVPPKISRIDETITKIESHPEWSKAVIVGEESVITAIRDIVTELLGTQADRDAGEAWGV